MQALLRLTRQHGELPSTREVAVACGIAEGTVFRAFETKQAMVDAAIGAVACPVPFITAIQAIDRRLPLRDRLYRGVDLLLHRFTEAFEVLGPLGVMGPPPHLTHPHCPEPGSTLPGPGMYARSHLVDLLAPDAELLRISVEELVLVIRILAFGGASPHLCGSRPLTAEGITDLVLYGVVRPSEPGHPVPRVAGSVRQAVPSC